MKFDAKQFNDLLFIIKYIVQNENLSNDFKCGFITYINSTVYQTLSKVSNYLSELMLCSLIKKKTRIMLNSFRRVKIQAVI